MIEIIKNISQEFFEKLGIKIDSLGVINEEENIFLVKLQTKDSSLVIGTNGKNLNNILSIIKLMLKNQIQEPIKVHIEVNDYLQNKDNKLKNYVISKIQIVERTGQDFKMPFFSAYERKKIHSIVGEYGNPKIYTKSVGEGNERRLFICKTDEKLTIDLDGSDI